MNSSKLLVTAIVASVLSTAAWAQGASGSQPQDKPADTASQPSDSGKKSAHHKKHHHHQKSSEDKKDTQSTPK